MRNVIPTTETDSLYQQITEWAEEQGWTATIDVPFFTHHCERDKAEKNALWIDTGEGNVYVEARGQRRDKFHYAEVFAQPTYLSVWITKKPKAKEWRYTTDGGIPLHWEWSKDTFIRLVHDLQNMP